MNNLESIVLSLAESQSLVEHGVVLDTALVWGMDYQETTTVFTHEYARDIFPDFKTFCAAPTAGELMEWIVAKYPACALEVLWSDDEWEMDLANDLPRICQGLNSKGSLVSALATLVLEVAG